MQDGRLPPSSTTYSQPRSERSERAPRSNASRGNSRQTSDAGDSYAPTRRLAPAGSRGRSGNPSSGKDKESKRAGLLPENAAIMFNTNQRENLNRISESYHHNQSPNDRRMLNQVEEHVESRLQFEKDQHLKEKERLNRKIQNLQFNLSTAKNQMGGLLTDMQTIVPNITSEESRILLDYFSKKLGDQLEEVPDGDQTQAGLTASPAANSSRLNNGKKYGNFSRETYNGSDSNEQQFRSLPGSMLHHLRRHKDYEKHHDDFRDYFESEVMQELIQQARRAERRRSSIRSSLSEHQDYMQEFVFAELVAFVETKNRSKREMEQNRRVYNSVVADLADIFGDHHASHHVDKFSRASEQASIKRSKKQFHESMLKAKPLMQEHFQGANSLHTEEQFHRLMEHMEDKLYNHSDHEDHGLTSRMVRKNHGFDKASGKTHAKPKIVHQNTPASAQQFSGKKTEDLKELNHLTKEEQQLLQEFRAQKQQKQQRLHPTILLRDDLQKVDGALPGDLSPPRGLQLLPATPRMKGSFFAGDWNTAAGGPPGAQAGVEQPYTEYRDGVQFEVNTPTPANAVATPPSFLKMDNVHLPHTSLFAAGGNNLLKATKQYSQSPATTFAGHKTARGSLTSGEDAEIQNSLRFAQGTYSFEMPQINMMPVFQPAELVEQRLFNDQVPRRRAEAVMQQDKQQTVTTDGERRTPSPSGRFILGQKPTNFGNKSVDTVYLADLTSFDSKKVAVDAKQRSNVTTVNSKQSQQPVIYQR
ncbi:unnamed protein product [Amoebophrya sp. A120]|nr:unnamed protein product [Amoebophrya sp. A120]|eukprot:GSA120T00013685001.1